VLVAKLPLPSDSLKTLLSKSCPVQKCPCISTPTAHLNSRESPCNLLAEKTSGLLLFDKVFIYIKVKIEVLKNKSLSLACYIYLQLQVSAVDEQDLVTKAIQKKLFLIEKCQKFESKIEGKGGCLLQRTLKNSYTK
jgi:hypothetical protein